VRALAALIKWAVAERPVSIVHNLIVRKGDQELVESSIFFFSLLGPLLGLDAALGSLPELVGPEVNRPGLLAALRSATLRHGERGR